jgi:rubrerythrin
VIDARTHAVLQEIMKRESRSLLQYVADSYPWATSEEQAALAQLRQVIEEERQGAAELGRFLTRHRLELPYLGAYPAEFTNANFIALDYLLPRLAADERRAIAFLEQALIGLQDAQARALVQKIVDKKRQHLTTLEGLAASHSPRAA